MISFLMIIIFIFLTAASDVKNRTEVTKIELRRPRVNGTEGFRRAIKSFQDDGVHTARRNLASHSYRQHDGKDRHGGDISCGKYSSHSSIKHACSTDSNCVGYSFRYGNPWCLKTKDSSTIDYDSDHVYYEKGQQIKEKYYWKTVFACEAGRKGLVQAFDPNDPDLPSTTSVRVEQVGFGSITNQESYTYPVTQLQSGNPLIGAFISTSSEVGSKWILEGNVNENMLWGDYGHHAHIYWSNGNGGGLHISRDGVSQCEWVYSNYRSAQNGIIELKILVPRPNGEEYCESSSMLRNEQGCKSSSCCHWNTWEQGEASFDGAGRCWSDIGRDTCLDMSGRKN